MKYKLRSSVSVVDLENGYLEFFKTNTRKSIKIKVHSDLIKKLVLRLDGETETEKICSDLGISYDNETTQQLFAFLKRKSILSNDNLVINREDYHRYRRIIHFLEDYAECDEDLLEMWENIRKANVLIIGMGAVGTWVAASLVQSGVKNIYLMDKDNVDISNIHRQFGFSENDIGKKKTEVIKRKLQQYDAEVVIYEINKYLEDGTLDSLDYHFDLIINCADKPTVDETSKIVGKYCMKKNIPHIVGGGYNLHLSLIGQTIIPKKTACVNCFEKQLEKINVIQGVSIKKLNTKNRKIGSFGPMCTVIASMVGMEAIKVLSKKIQPDNINRRGDFNIYDMNISYTAFKKLDNCKWCEEL